MTRNPRAASLVALVIAALALPVTATTGSLQLPADLDQIPRPEPKALDPNGFASLPHTGHAESTPQARQADQATDGEGGTDANFSGPLVSVQLEVVEKTVNVLGVPYTAWTFNGVVPGPVIRITEGTVLEVVLVNGHNQPHSIHTHLRGNLLASDGSSDTAPLPIVPHQHNALPLEQNPIGPYEPREDRDVAVPGSSYTYTYFADTPGTFLYHCHVFLATEHISRGLYGLIEVYPKGWTWEDFSQDALNGNTKARVTDNQGRQYFEDVVMMSEITPGAAPSGGAPAPSQDVWVPTGVPLSGMTPPGVGKVHLANFRAWNDPYEVGPVRPNEKVRLIVANIGDEYHDWHVHSHWFDVIDKISRDQKPLYTTDAMITGPGDSYVTTLTAGAPGFWFMHDHNVPEAHTGMVPWLHIEGEPVPNVPADVTVDEPLDGAVVAGKVLFKGWADDFEGREMVQGVEIRIDEGAWEPADGLLQWRYAWDSTLVSDGPHALSVRAFDGRDYSAEQIIGVIVRNAGWDAAGSSPSPQSTPDEGAAKGGNSPALGFVALVAAVAGIAWIARRRGGAE